GTDNQSLRPLVPRPRAALKLEQLVLGLPSILLKWIKPGAWYPSWVSARAGERTIQAVRKSRLSAEFPRLGQSVDPCVEPRCARLDVVGVEPAGPACDRDGHYVRPVLPAQRRHPCVRSYHIPLTPTSELGELHHDLCQFAVHSSTPLLLVYG